MRIRRAVVQLGIAVVLVEAAAAQQYAPKAEFKCMQSVAKAGAKFIGSKTKCVGKCFTSVWKGLLPASECDVPYGAFAAGCIASAEGKFGAAIRKACDPTINSSAACPQCYSGGDCGLSGEAGTRVASFENQMDSLFPDLFCETAPTPFHLEIDCMVTAAKGVAKYFAKVTKCYDKCYGLVQKGLAASGVCQPPASEPFTVTCLDDARANYVKFIKHDCGPPPASPDGCGSPYPTAEEWIDMTNTMAGGDVSLTYCASPGGAFVD
jgi:hypothetical protein